MTNAVYYKIYCAKDSAKTLKKNKILNSVSLALKIASLCLLVLAFAKTLWLLVPAAILFVAGVTLRQVFLESTASFAYTVSDGELIVSKTTMLGAEKHLFSGNIADVTEFSSKASTAIGQTISVIKATDKTDFSEILFDLGDKIVKIQFTPDDYMTALIKKQTTRRNNDLS